MSAFRKMKNRLGKRASKFKLTCTVQSCLVELNTKRWSPNDICVVWSRRGRKHASEYRQWEPSVTDNLKGQLVWPDSSPVDFNVTLYRNSKHALFESKPWEYLVVDRDKLGKKKILARGRVDMAFHVQQSMDNVISVEMKAVSKKITYGKLEICLSAELLREGKATDEDMISIASLSSTGIPDEDLEEDLEEDDDWNDVGGSREDLVGSASPRPTSPFIPIPESVVPEQLLAWAQSVTAEYRSVKLVNMTTSWRNGLGFLAIIHHFHPELLDYPSLSSVNIRENIYMVRDLCRQLRISCRIRPDVMESSGTLQADTIAAFVYQLFLGLTKKGPEALPPVPKVPQDMKSGFSSGSDVLTDYLVPPGVHRQKPPTFVADSSDEVIEQETTSPEELPLRESSNATPTGEHMPVIEYHSSPTFIRSPRKMYVGVEEEQSSSEDEDVQTRPVDSRIRKVSDVKTEREELPERGAWKGRRDTFVGGDADIGSSGLCKQVDSSAQEQTVLHALREGHQTEGCVSSGPDSNMSSPSWPPQLSVSDISLTEVSIPGALPTLAEETADTRQAGSSKHSRREGDSSKESKRRLPPVPGGVRAERGGASVIIVLEGTERAADEEAPPSHDHNRGPITSTKRPSRDETSQTAPASSSPKRSNDRKKEIPSTPPRSSNNASRRVTSPNAHLPLNHYGNATPPPMPSKDKRRRASEDPSALSVADNLPVRRLPQPKKPSSTSQMEPFQRPATADMLDNRTDEDSAQPIRNRVSSCDRLPVASSSPSPVSRRRRNKASLTTILASQGLASNPPSAAAVEISHQAPKASQHSVLEELEASTKEERIENLPIQSGKKGLLKTLTNGKKNGGGSPPIPEENSHSLEPQCTEDDATQEGGLKSVVEYHQEERKQIQEQLQSLEGKRELIQCDLNNARSKGDRESLQRLTNQWLEMLQLKNQLVHRQTELDIMSKEEDLERRSYEVHRDLKKYQELEDYQKTREEKERESELLDELVAIVNERAVLEERKLAYEINKENEAEGMEQMKQEGVAMASNMLTDDEPASKKDCSIM